MSDPEILHVERLGGGSFLITGGDEASFDDVNAWLWRGDPPEGASLHAGVVMLGWTTFQLDGMSEDNMASLSQSALQWIMYSQQESYREHQERLKHDDEQHEELMNSEVPYMGGLTFRQVWDNWDGWQGLYPTTDGYLVWIGFDRLANAKVVQVYPGIEGTDEVGFNANVRWYIENQNMSLNYAAATELQERWNEMALAVFVLGH